MTRDQTLAQRCRDLGLPVLKASWHHVLTNCLGAKDHEVRVEFHHLRLADGDRLLLCTDGLTDMVDDARIAATLDRGMLAAETCRALVDLALEGGGKDNVTTVVCGYRIAPQP